MGIIFLIALITVELKHKDNSWSKVLQIFQYKSIWKGLNRIKAQRYWETGLTICCKSSSWQ
jgi:hypothetical protein